MTDQTDNGVEEREPFDIKDPSEFREPVADDHSGDEAEEAVEADDNSGETEETDAKTDAPESVDIGNIDEYLDSDLAKAVKGLLEKMSGEIQTLREQVKNQPVAPAATAPARDSIFSDNEELFGSDAPSPAQMRNRNRVREQMDILKAGYKSAGKTVPSSQELFNKAFRAEFAEESLNKERSQFVNKVRNREQQIISRPSSRSSTAGNARSRAVDAVQRRLREMGQ
jgi:hypothetical protein